MLVTFSKRSASFTSEGLFFDNEPLGGSGRAGALAADVVDAFAMSGHFDTEVTRYDARTCWIAGSRLNASRQTHHRHHRSTQAQHRATVSDMMGPMIHDERYANTCTCRLFAPPAPCKTCAACDSPSDKHGQTRCTTPFARRSRATRCLTCPVRILSAEHTT